MIDSTQFQFSDTSQIDVRIRIISISDICAICIPETKDACLNLHPNGHFMTLVLMNLKKLIVDRLL